MATTYIIRTFGGVVPITLNTAPIVPPTPNVTCHVRRGDTRLTTRSGVAAVIVKGTTT